MTRSVRLGLVNRLHRHVDQMGKRIAKYLSRNKAHAVTGHDGQFGVAGAIGVNSAQRQTNYPVVNPVFGHNVMIDDGRGLCIANRQFNIPNSVGLLNNFSGHQVSPLGNNCNDHLASLNAKAAGVES